MLEPLGVRLRLDVGGCSGDVIPELIALNLLLVGVPKLLV